jgi:hypothetical protein
LLGPGYPATTTKKNHMVRKQDTTTPRTNTPADDVGPFDSEGWKVNTDDGSRVHRYDCTSHVGEPCDGHCGPQ